MDEKIQDVISSYFKRDNILTSHQIESYDDFVDNILPKIMILEIFPMKLAFNDDHIKKIQINITNINPSIPICTENNGETKNMTPNHRDLEILHH